MRKLPRMQHNKKNEMENMRYLDFGKDVKYI